MKNKFKQLQKYIKTLDKQGMCLAFSGGIDSTLLLYLCKDFNFTAVTFKSVFQTEEEIKLTIELCKKYEVKQEIIEFSPLENPILINNPEDRCYHCKKLFFTKLKEHATPKNLIDGTNFDDLNVYRPGLKALKELDIISPLAKFEITKQEIREYAKKCGIEIFDKPSTPCLATRFPYGTKLTEENLKVIEQGENVLQKLGFKECRLRLHDDIARIEIPIQNFDDFILKKDEIIKNLKSLGLKYITLDIEGLRIGSMDM